MSLASVSGLLGGGIVNTNTSSQRPAVSVVVPCFGCASCLRALHERLVASLEALGKTFEILLVNDSSPDADWSVIQELAAVDPRVIGIELARNFGQHHAIAAGLDHAEGDVVVVMDCDLQHQPEDLGVLLAPLSDGFDGAFGRRVVRQDGVWKKWTSRAFFSVFGLLAGMKIDPTVCNYSALRRAVVLELRRFRESNRNYPLHAHWLGFRYAYVPIRHSARHSGESSYSLARMVGFAAQTILTQSNTPLRLSIDLGFIIAAFAFVFGAFLVVRRAFWAVPVEGWTSLIVALFFLFGLLFVVLGVLGLYVGSVFTEVKGRPLYVVRSTTRAEVARPPGSLQVAGSAGSISPNNLEERGRN